jgi:hypothetical protein
MNSEKLSQLLRNQDAIDALSMEEVDQLIQSYPYLQQLREIKARKVEGTDEKAQNLQNEAAFYRPNWNEHLGDKHEVLDLSEALEAIAAQDSASVEHVNLPPVAKENESSNKALSSDDNEATSSVQMTIQDEANSVILEEDVDSEVIPEISGQKKEGEDAAEQELNEEPNEALIESSLEEVSKEGSREVLQASSETLDTSDEKASKDHEVLENQKEEDDVSLKDENSKNEKSVDLIYHSSEQKVPLISLDDLTENALVQIKKKKKKSKKKNKLQKLKDKKKGKKKKGDSSKKEKLVKKDSKPKERKSKDAKKVTGKESKKISSKNLKKAKKKKKGKEDYLTPKSDYAKWLLAQKQISDKGKKRKKKTKTVEKAMESVKKKRGVVSEPLAELLAAQGHYNQAKAMYQELSLIFPEKSTYFAAQIEKIENNK